MFKKLWKPLCAAMLVAVMLCACAPSSDPGSNPSSNPGPNPSSNPGGSNPGTPDPTPGTPNDADAAKEVVLSSYFGQKDAWETDGGDVFVEADQIVFDNDFMGDFAALRLKEAAKNVTYKFNIQLASVHTDLSMDEGTWWDSEILILGRSTLAGPGWGDGQTGYCLTSWGDMSEVYIGRSGYDDAFGSVQWNINDGQPHAIELSLTNNADNTAVTIELKVDGVSIFTGEDDGSLVKQDRPALYPDAGGLTIRCKFVKAVIS